MANGDFLAKIKLVLEGKDQVVRGLEQTQQAAQQLSKTKVTTVFDKQGVATGKQIEETFTKIKPAAAQAATGMKDFEKALSRVMIVAPVWMAARAAIQLVTTTIQEGFQVWQDFERQLIKSKAVVHGFSGTTEEAMVKLESRIREFSKESGIALTDLTSAFYRFGTVGIKFEESLSGAIASAKLATATLGDTDTISRSLAMTYRLLGDSIDQTLSPMEKQESLAGKIFHLWKTNAFESNEFASSLNNFASTANVANFTTDQTISLLSALGTAGVQGARGGTLLKTAIQKLVENLDILAPKLGIAVNPELENTFDVFMKVLETINKLSQTKGVPVEALNSIKEIFGGVRGGQVITALNALLPELKKNLSDVGKDPQEFIKGLNDRFKEVNDTLPIQLDILKRMKETIGETFVKGITGADDFKDALKSVNAYLVGVADLAGEVGKFIKFWSNPVGAIKKEFKLSAQEAELFGKRVDDALAGILSLSDTVATINMVEDLWGKDAYSKDVVNRIRSTAVGLSDMLGVQERVNQSIEDYNTNVIQAGKPKAEQINPNQNLLNQLELQTKSAKEGLNVINLQTKGYGEGDIALSKLTQEVDKMVELYNSLDKVQAGTLPTLDKQVVLTDAMNRNWQGIIDKSKGTISVVNELTNLAKSRDKVEAAVLQQYLKQDQAIKNQYINYEKADMLDRERLRRLMELQTKKPDELAQAFEGSAFDKNIITEYWSTFSKEGQDSINTVLQRLYQLPTLDINAAMGNKNNAPGAVAGAVPVQLTQSVIGAQNVSIVVNGAQMTAKQVSDAFAAELYNNPEFRKAIADAAVNTNIPK